MLRYCCTCGKCLFPSWQIFGDSAFVPHREFFSLRSCWSPVAFRSRPRKIYRPCRFLDVFSRQVLFICWLRLPFWCCCLSGVSHPLPLYLVSTCFACWHQPERRTCLSWASSAWGERETPCPLPPRVAVPSASNRRYVRQDEGRRAACQKNS